MATNLQQAPLSSHQHGRSSQSPLTCARARKRRMGFGRITDIAVRGSLPGPDELVVLCPERPAMASSSLAQVPVEDSVSVRGTRSSGVQTSAGPLRRSARLPRSSISANGACGTCNAVIRSLLDLRRQGDLLLPGGQKLRPGRRQQLVAALHQHLVLLGGAAASASQARGTEPCRHRRQQRFVMSHDEYPTMSSKESKLVLPGHQFPAQVGQIEVVLETGLKVVRREQLHQVIGLREHSGSDRSRMTQSACLCESPPD